MKTTYPEIVKSELTPDAVDELQAEIRELAVARNAIVMAHNYQRPEVQDVADFRRRFACPVEESGQHGARRCGFLRRALHG
ncbi:MAG: quinolinate synthase NadA [Gemmatimonadales bacterium]